MLRRKNAKNFDQVKQEDTDSFKTDNSSYNPAENDSEKKTKLAGLIFWFKRADFYVTGMNFVLTRIA